MADNDTGTVAGCTGGCCERFYFGVTAEQLYSRDWSTVEDGPQIRDMLVHLQDDGQAGGYYSCRHWDRASRRCGIYAARPKMCAEYPYGNRCQTCGADNFDVFEPVRRHRRRLASHDRLYFTARYLIWIHDLHAATVA